MKYGVWCVVPRCWLKNSVGQPKVFDEKLSAIVACNEMRYMLRKTRDPNYTFEVRPLV